MPASEAISAQGTFISRKSDSSPAEYVELAEVKNIGGPDEQAEEIDVTHLRSPEGYREFIQSFKDGGELPLTLNFVLGSATQQQLRDDFDSGDSKDWQITYPDTSTCVFTAWVKRMGAPVQVGNALELNATLRIVGPTTWTYAS